MCSFKDNYAFEAPRTFVKSMIGAIADLPWDRTVNVEKKTEKNKKRKKNNKRARDNKTLGRCPYSQRS